MQLRGAITGIASRAFTAFALLAGFSAVARDPSLFASHNASKNRPAQRLIAATPEQPEMSDTVPHSVFDPKLILDPPPGFGKYREYQGTFNLPKDTAGIPDYFNIDKLKGKGVNNVDSFLAQLPDIFKKRVVTVNKSGSSHISDDKHPRFIMHNYEPNGRSVDNHALDIIAVGTHPDDPAVNQVERITYDPRTKRFNFFAIDLETGRNLPTEDCAKCHTDHLRPNFDPAHNWPSVIGAGEHFNTFDKNEREMMSAMHAENPIARKHFKLEDLMPSDEEQSPATVFFYGLFGPVHHYVSDKMFENDQYQKNRVSVLKVLAGCEGEIQDLKQQLPGYFFNQRQEMLKTVPKFKFDQYDKDKEEPMLGYDPIQLEDYTDTITALASLLKTNKDPNEIGWLGKTSKGRDKYIYTHAFYKQDFDMLIGGLCERDEKVKALLIKNGANPENPCYDKGQSSKKICQEMAAPPNISQVVRNDPKTIDGAKVDSCVRTQQGVSRDFFCVGEGSEQRIVMWTPADGFYFCANDPNATVCPGQQQKLESSAQKKILDQYVAMEKARQGGMAIGTSGTFRDQGQRNLANRAIQQARQVSLEDAAKDKMPGGEQPKLQRCIYNRAQAWCTNDNGLRVIRYDAGAGGLHYCSRSETNCPAADRKPISVATQAALMKQYEPRVRAAERENPASIGNPARQTMTQKIFYRYEDKGRAQDGGTPPPAQNPPPGATPPAQPPQQPNPPATVGNLAQTRAAVARVLIAKCFSCHKASAEPNQEAFDGYPMPANVRDVNEAYVASLATMMISEGKAMDRILARVEDKGSPMPPGRYEAGLAQMIRNWVNLEKQAGK